MDKQKSINTLQFFVTHLSNQAQNWLIKQL